MSFVDVRRAHSTARSRSPWPRLVLARPQRPEGTGVPLAGACTRGVPLCSTPSFDILIICASIYLHSAFSKAQLVPTWLNCIFFRHAIYIYTHRILIRCMSQKSSFATLPPPVATSGAILRVRWAMPAPPHASAGRRSRESGLRPPLRNGKREPRAGAFLPNLLSAAGAPGAAEPRSHRLKTPPPPWPQSAQRTTHPYRPVTLTPQSCRAAKTEAGRM